MSNLGTFKDEILEELKNSKYNDLEDLVNRFQLTYDEVIDVLDLKYIVGPTTGYTLPLGIYEIIDVNFKLKSLHTKEVKVNITIDDVSLKSNLTKIKQSGLLKKCFFYLSLGFTQSRLGVLSDIPGFIQLIPGSYQSDKPINIRGIDKVQLKADCIQGSIVNGTREPVLYSFALYSPPGHKTYKEPRVNYLKR